METNGMWDVFCFGDLNNKIIGINSREEIKLRLNTEHLISTLEKCQIRIANMPNNPGKIFMQDHRTLDRKVLIFIIFF